MRVHMRWEGGGGSGVLKNEYSCAHGAQINFGDLTPYLTYETNYIADHKVRALNSYAAGVQILHGKS